MAGILDIPKGVHKALANEAKVLSNDMRTAGSRALNKTARTGRTQAGRLIRQEAPLKAGTVRKQLKVRRATKRALESAVEARYKPIPAHEFKPRQTRKGVTVTFNKKRGRTLLPSAFIATGQSGETVFKRVGRSRLPIKKQFGPPITAYFSRNLEALVQLSDDVLERNLEHETLFILSKLRKR